MDAKPCSRCVVPLITLSGLLSKYRTKPRQQKCTTSISFCNACIHALIGAIGSIAPVDLIEPLREAYTAFSGYSYDHSQSKSNPDSAALDPEFRSKPTTETAPKRVAGSCLIACNSREFDEVTEGTLFQPVLRNRAVIDKLDLRIPGSAFFTQEVSKYLREFDHAEGNPRVRRSRFYQAVVDLRPLGVDALLHYRYRKPPHDSKLEVLDVGKKAYSGLVRLVSNVAKAEADALGTMRIDLCADIADVPVLWFQPRVRFKYKRFAREDGELKYAKIGSRGVQTLTSGKRPNLFRIYDKPAECLVQFNKLCRRSSSDADELSFEKEFGFPPNAVLTRVERQIAGKQVPPELSSFGALPKAPDFNPFTPLEIIAGNHYTVPTVEEVGLSEWLQGTRIAQLAEEMGMQQLRGVAKPAIARNASRILQKYTRFLPSAEGGISNDQIYQIYRKSTMQQLAS